MVEGKKDRDVYRYFPTVDRSAAEQQMAVEFLDDFFQGSPSNLLMSLLGSKRISKEDADRVKRLIENSSAPAPSRKKGERAMTNVVFSALASALPAWFLVRLMNVARLRSWRSASLWL